jgi:hypothetical protein
MYSRNFLSRKFSILTFSAAAFISFTVGISAAHATGSFTQGSGTLDDPYIITTCQQLQDMSVDLDAKYALGADVDCSATRTWNYDAGTSQYLGFEPVGTIDSPFTGNLAGNNYSISNLFINRHQQDGVGIFGSLSGGVTNLILEHAHVLGYHHVGAIAGVVTRTGSITRTSVNETTSSQQVC